MGLLFFRYLRLIGRIGALLALLACASGHTAYGQVPMKRVYATSQTHGGTSLPLLSYTITNQGNAVDGVPSSHSTIGIRLVGEVWQRLQFPTNRPAGSTVRVKIGTTGNILGLLGNIEIQAFQGNNNPRGAAAEIGDLITLLAGEDQAEIVFTPTASYNSVRIRSSGIALGGGFKIYDAYYLEPASPESIDCDTAADVLYGSTGNIGGLNAVTNAYNAIDGDLDSYATLHANVSVGNRTHLTALYNTVSQADDSIRVVLRSPAALLDAGILSSSLRIRTLLDDTDNGDLALNPQLVSLRLLTPGSDIQVLTYPVSTPFNRVEISLGDGLLDALATLQVYEIQRAMARPLVTAVNMEADSVVICESESTTLFIDNPQADADYYWYTSPTGGDPVSTGPELTVEPEGVGDFTYYAARARQGCLEESERTRVVVHALQQPHRPYLSITDIQH